MTSYRLNFMAEQNEAGLSVAQKSVFLYGASASASPWRLHRWPQLRTWFAFILALYLLMMAEPANAQQPSPLFDIDQVPPPTGRPSARLGQPVYLDSCAPCHGETGQGDGPTAASLPGPATPFAHPAAIWERSPAELFFTAKFGRLEKLMPPWGNRLSDDQIWQTVSYAWSLHTSEAEVNQGKALYAENCAACHGASGAGDGPSASEALPDFSDPGWAMASSQAAWLSGWRNAHADVGALWTEAESRSVLEYLRTFSYAPPWEPAYRPGDGAVVGQVVQGTPGGAAAVDLDVMLEAFLGFDPVAVFTTTVDADGQFRFENLAIDANLVYLASVQSDGIDYSSPAIALTADAPLAETGVTIYEAGDDPSAIVIDRMHWIVDSQPGTLIVGQIVQLGNQGTQTFAGRQVEGIDEAVTAAIWVPSDAQEIGLENGLLGERFKQLGNWIYDTAPVLPGELTRQIVLRYSLPYAGTEVRMEQEFQYPVAGLNLLIADLPGLAVDAVGLESQGSQEIQGNSYQIWQGAEIQPGVLDIQLTGLVATGDLDPRALASDDGAVGALPANTPPLTDRMAWFMGGFLIVVLAGLFVWSWQLGLAGATATPEELRQEQERLVRRIAQLDDVHMVGEVDDESWQRQRAELKAQLLSVATRLKQMHDSVQTSTSGNRS